MQLCLEAGIFLGQLLGVLLPIRMGCLLRPEAAILSVKVLGVLLPFRLVCSLRPEAAILSVEVLGFLLNPLMLRFGHTTPKT